MLRRPQGCCRDSVRICGGREGEGGRDHAHMTHVVLWGGMESIAPALATAFEGSRVRGSRVRGSRVRIPGLTPKGSSALGVWVATRHPVTSCGLSEEGLCANFARDMRAAPRAVVGSCRGGAGIPSRGRYLRRCPRDPWDLFCFHLQPVSSFLLGGERRSISGSAHAVAINDQGK